MSSDQRQPSRLGKLGRHVHQHRLAFLLIPVVACLLTVPFALRATDRLSTSGWLPSGAESVTVAEVLKVEFGRDSTSHYLLFRDPTGELKATDEEFRQQVAMVVAPLASHPAISEVYTWGSTNNQVLNRSLLSDDQSMSLAIVVIANLGQSSSETFDDFRDLISSERLDVTVGGWAATAANFSELTESDLLRSEKFALPFTLLLLFFVFGGVLAAGLPVTLAILALIPTLAGIFALSHVTETSIFAVNTVSMLGLALGVDYALILVSRFREELGKHETERALINAMSTAGETILVSGLAVMVGLLGLLSFRVPAATSTAISAGLIVLLCLVLAMTSLPAALSLLGPRLRARPRQSRLRLLYPDWSGSVKRHPVIATMLTIGCIAVLTLPMLDMRGAAASMTILPTSQEARQVYDTVETDFSRTTLTPILVIVSPTDGRMTSAQNLNELREFQRTLEQLEGVTSTQSLWSFVPLGATSSIVSASMLVDDGLRDATRNYVTENAAVIEIAPALGPSDEATMDLVRAIRTNAEALSGGSFTVQIGAEVGTNVDLAEYVRERAPLTIAIVVSLMWIALFIRFRSIVLPTKAVFLNLLSLGASFGALVWIFQEGHLHRWLGFEPLGYTILLVPIIMFCFMFGLSMDYEVVMLSRIKEVWDETGDNDQAIERGLDASARLVTSAALIMIVVFLAFSTSELQFIKQVGVGLGIAVIIDTTLIRLILLPSTMRLFGSWNWWSPWNKL